jgi:ABC-type amino acid transport substrate-binding protein
VKSFSDLGGKRVAAIAGTTNEKALAEAIKKRLVNATVVTVQTRDEGLAALEAGKVHGFASDKVLIVGLSGKVKDPTQYTMLAEDLSFEPYAIMLPRGDAPFRLAVNRGLAQLYRSPAIGELWNRWFGPLGKPGVLVEAMFFLGAIPE